MKYNRLKKNSFLKFFYFKYKNFYSIYKIYLKNKFLLNNININLYLYKNINLNKLRVKVYFLKNKLFNLLKFLLYSYFFFKNNKLVYIKKQTIDLMEKKVNNYIFKDSKKKFYKLLFIKKMNIKLKKKKILKLKKKSCFLILKKNNNNFFCILSDFKGKIIFYNWVGQFNDSHNIKNKRSFYLIFNIAKNILKKLKRLKINNLVVKIRSNITSQMYGLLGFLKNYNIKVNRIIFRRPIPHHLGQRKKKLRRI